MTYVVVFLVGALIGCLITFLFYHNNQSKVNSVIDKVQQDANKVASTTTKVVNDVKNA